MKNGSLLLLFLASASGLLAGTGTGTERSKSVPQGGVSVSNYTAKNFKCVIAGDSMSGNWKTIPGQNYYKYPGKVFKKTFTWGKDATPTQGIVNPQLACGISVVIGKPKILLTVPYEDLKENLAGLEIRYGGEDSSYIIYSPKKKSPVAIMTNSGK